ncbi:MAG: hypothetical protein Tsb005_07580 [Gammaproteobacteria bacterium]
MARIYSTTVPTFHLDEKISPAERALLAAKQQLHLCGYADTQMDAIAMQAGLTLSKLKRCYADKTAITKACISDNIQQLQQAFNPLLQLSVKSDLEQGEVCDQFISALDKLFEYKLYHAFIHHIATEIVGVKPIETHVLHYLSTWADVVKQVLLLVHKTGKVTILLQQVLITIQGGLFYRRVYRNNSYLDVSFKQIRELWPEIETAVA